MVKMEKYNPEDTSQMIQIFELRGEFKTCANEQISVYKGRATTAFIYEGACVPCGAVKLCQSSAFKSCHVVVLAQLSSPSSEGQAAWGHN